MEESDEPNPVLAFALGCLAAVGAALLVLATLPLALLRRDEPLPKPERHP